MSQNLDTMPDLGVTRVPADAQTMFGRKGDRTASLTYTPTGKGGNVWVHLDKDPGSGSMSYPDSATVWTITGGHPDALRRMVADYVGREKVTGYMHPVTAAWLDDVRACLRAVLQARDAGIAAQPCRHLSQHCSGPVSHVVDLAHNRYDGRGTRAPGRTYATFAACDAHARMHVDVAAQTPGQPVHVTTTPVQS